MKKVKKQQSEAFSQNAKWIWRKETENGINQYVEFRRDFTLTHRPLSVEACISVDSDYLLFINGKEMQGRQFPSYPHDRVYNVIDLNGVLKKGKNTVAILAYYRGKDASEYRLGRAGLLFEIHEKKSKKTPLLVSDSSFKTRLSKSYKSGLMPAVSAQMGFTVEYNAYKEDQWMSPEKPVPQDFKPAVTIAGPTDGYWKSLRKRPMPFLTTFDFEQAGLILSGDVIRNFSKEDFQNDNSRFMTEEASAELKKAGVSTAKIMSTDYKRISRYSGNPVEAVVLNPPKNSTEGSCLIYDLGEEFFGLLSISVDTPKGTVFDIAHGEHLEDMGVRMYVGSRSFADRYISRGGKQEWTLPFRRLGTRYLQIHILNHKKKVTVHKVGLYEVRVPVKKESSFKCPDTIIHKLRDVSKRTLHRSKAEHFADCPWREQSLYAWDSRNSALYNYYTFGTFSYPKESIRLLGDGLREDGLLELCAPARVPVTIPVFTLIWIGSVFDQWLYGGDLTTFKEYRPAVKKILETFYQKHDKASGLYGLFSGQGYWTFYEWADGLDFKNGYNFDDDGKFRLDAIHNLNLLEQTRNASKMFEALGDLSYARELLKRAAALKKAIYKFFWDEKKQLFASFTDRKRKWHYSQTVQALCILNGVGTKSVHNKIRRSFFESEKIVPATLASLKYLAEAMIGAPEKDQALFLQKCKDIYTPMLYKGSTTFWETEKGADDFDQAGSLCHAWSAVFLWLSGAYILGIRPKDAGFKTFFVDPHPSDLPYAEGEVFTPKGTLKVSWHKEKNQLVYNVKGPKGVSPVLSARLQKQKVSFFWNGKKQ